MSCFFIFRYRYPVTPANKQATMSAIFDIRCDSTEGYASIAMKIDMVNPVPAIIPVLIICGQLVCAGRAVNFRRVAM
nr:hypothetical protein [Chitinophaga rhizophila]